MNNNYNPGNINVFGVSDKHKELIGDTLLKMASEHVDREFMGRDERRYALLDFDVIDKAEFEMLAGESLPQDLAGKIEGAIIAEFPDSLVFSAYGDGIPHDSDVAPMSSLVIEVFTSGTHLYSEWNLARKNHQA